MKDKAISVNQEMNCDNGTPFSNVVVKATKAEHHKKSLKRREEKDESSKIALTQDKGKGSFQGNSGFKSFNSNSNNFRQNDGQRRFGGYGGPSQQQQPYYNPGMNSNNFSGYQGGYDGGGYGKSYDNPAQGYQEGGSGYGYEDMEEVMEEAMEEARGVIQGRTKLEVKGIVVQCSNSRCRPCS
jgi:hypothetical protein